MVGSSAEEQPIPTTSGAASTSFNAAAPSTRPHRYYREPWSATAWEQARLFMASMLCLGGSGAIAKTAVAPLERIKILLQVQHLTSRPHDHYYRGVWDAARKIPEREGGWRALYRGNGANVLRLVPEVSFRFIVHDQLKLMLAPASGHPTGTLDKLAAGAATGVLRSLLFHPLDVCRVRITADTTPLGQTAQYRTLRQGLARIYVEEGLTGLYKGLLPSMLGIVPYLAISLTAYDTYKQALPLDKASRSQWWYPLAKMGAGSLAAVTAQVVVYPLDTIRRRMQMSGAQGTTTQYRNSLHCLRTMVQTEGLPSLYRGMWASCLRTVPGAAVQFMAYDLIKTGLSILDPTTAVTSPLLVNVIGFLADKVLAAPWMSALYLHHSYPQWWQFFTHMFMHANLDHLMSNMFFLLTFGRMVEEVEGPWGLGFVYLLGGLGAALVSFLLTPKNVVSVGASGAVFAIFSVSVLTRLTSFNFRRLLESVVLGQFVIKQVLGEVQQQVAGGLVVGGLHVSHIAHLGGALAGVLIVLLLSGVPADGKP